MYKKRTRNTEETEEYHTSRTYAVRTKQSISVIKQGVTLDKGKYKTFGFSSAEDSASNSEAIATSLDRVFDMVREDQKLDNEKVANTIKSLEAEQGICETNKSNEITVLAANKESESNKKDEIKTLEDEIQDVENDTKGKEEEIKQLYEEIDRINDNDKIKDKEEKVKRIKEKINFIQKNLSHSTGEMLALTLSSIIVLFLTAFLLLFYSAIFRGSELTIQLLNIINANAYTDLESLSRTINNLVGIIPLTLGLGVFVLAKNKNKTTRIWSQTGVYSTAFILDSVLGYLVSQAVHNQNYISTKVSNQWEFSMVFSDPHFYLILILGFLTYILWGVLVNYILKHPALQKNDEIKKKQITAIKEKIKICTKDLREIERNIRLNEGNIETLEKNIKSVIDEISKYNKGVEQISTAFLKGSIGEFINGWNDYTNGKFVPDVAKIHIKDASEQQAKWLQIKLENLQKNNIVILVE
ncbi:MAG: coiled-coil domain-containing protein 22 [Dysgonamonadaceae bacterium]|nr:coiled-coil domain-containing protein 22 [Dysgonamonadaceae bacterium]